MGCPPFVDTHAHTHTHTPPQVQETETEAEKRSETRNKDNEDDATGRPLRLYTHAEAAIAGLGAVDASSAWAGEGGRRREACPSGGGGILSTRDDYLRFVETLLTGTCPRTGHVLLQVNDPGHCRELWVAASVCAVRSLAPLAMSVCARLL